VRGHQKRTLILGLGNTILRDDAAGIIVARKVFEEVDRTKIELVEASYAGWRLIDILAGRERVIIIDSLLDAQCKPGECCRIELSQLKSAHLSASHGMGLAEALELARQNGAQIPKRISVYAVGVKNPYEFGEELSPEVEQRVPEIAREIIAEEKLAHARVGNRKQHSRKDR